jgi:hypothetical protein
MKDHTAPAFNLFKSGLRLAAMIGFLLLILCALVASALDGRVVLSWITTDTNLSAITFRVYHSTNLVRPAPWDYYAEVQGTNLLRTTLVPGVHFMYCTASNFWGETSPSNIAGTPPAPEFINTLRIQKDGN